MGRTISKTVSIDAPTDKVFAVLKDVEHWPEWTPTMAFIKRLDSGPFTVGSRAQVHQPKLRPAIWQVTEIEESRSFTWTTRAPGLCMKAGHRVEGQVAGSRVALTLEISGLMTPLVWRLYGRLIDEYVTAEAQGLKKRCEAAVDPGSR